MEENELLEITAWEKKLVDLPTPFIGRTGAEVPGKADIDAARTRPLPCARRRP